MKRRRNLRVTCVCVWMCVCVRERERERERENHNQINVHVNCWVKYFNLSELECAGSYLKYFPKKESFVLTSQNQIYFVINFPNKKENIIRDYMLLERVVETRTRYAQRLEAPVYI